MDKHRAQVEIESLFEDKDEKTVADIRIRLNIILGELHSNSYNWGKRNGMYKSASLLLDFAEKENKMLIPCEKAWIERKNALNSLRRIPHWKSKGYSINDITYLSLLGVVSRNSNINS